MSEDNKIENSPIYNMKELLEQRKNAVNKVVSAPTQENKENKEPINTPEDVVDPENTEATEYNEDSEDSELVADDNNDNTSETTNNAVDADSEPEHKRSKAAEKRIAALTREKYLLKGQLQALQNNNNNNNNNNQGVQSNQVKPVIQNTQDNTAPVRENYTDEVDFRVDLALYNRDLQEKNKQIAKRFDEAKTKYTDIDDLIAQDAERVSQGIRTANDTMVELIKDSDIAGDLWHYLLAHPQEAVEIAKLNPIRTAKAMGVIESKLTTTATKPVIATNKKQPLPTPITPVKTTNKVVVKPANFGFTVY